MADGSSGALGGNSQGISTTSTPVDGLHPVSTSTQVGNAPDDPFGTGTTNDASGSTTSANPTASIAPGIGSGIPLPPDVTTYPTIAQDTSLPTATATRSPSSETSSAAAAPSHGLSTGAKAGIGVSVGVGALIIIGALVWFFLRRARGGSGGRGPGMIGEFGADRHQQTQDLMAEKEAHTGVAESPHSPYSDQALNGSRDLHYNGAAGVGLVGATSQYDHTTQPAPLLSHQEQHEGYELQQQPPRKPPDHQLDTAGRSYSPYGAQYETPFDEAEQPQPPYHHPRSLHGSTASSTAAAAATTGTGSGTATPQGISTRYAHLVEDGMTSDEIQRLEEEERALDDAIEARERTQ